MSQSDLIKQMLAQKGLMRARDLAALGVSRMALQRLYLAGEVERVGRGLYTLPAWLEGEHQALAEVSQYAPSAVICLLSALYFHQLTTELPYEVWVAIPKGGHTPRIAYPTVRVMHISEPAFSYGIETYTLEGGRVRIYDVAKTVVDCFKFRNRLGLEVALAALRQVLTEKRVSVDRLWQAAKVCRMTNVMKPYLEALL